MNTSEFYMTAINMINNETLRLDNFCDALAKDADEKKKQIVEYKRAKYRYAGITNVWCVLRLNYRNRATNARTNYLAPKINEIFTSNERYFGLYMSAPEDKKADYALYFGVKSFAEDKLKSLEKELALATDWEKVELEDRIDGIKFAISCLNTAWQSEGKCYDEGKA